MAEGQCIFCAFVGRVDLSLAGGTTSSFLSLGFTEDRAATARDDVSAHGAEFEEFEFRSNRDGVPDLVSPACVSIRCEFMVFVGERRGGIGVDFCVVGVRESEEGFQDCFGFRLEGNAVRGC